MMKKLANFIVNQRYLVLILFVLISVFSLFIANLVPINYNIQSYLPKDNETKIGNDIMLDEFGDFPTSTLLVMFHDIKDENKILNQLKNIKYVDSVDFDESSDYHKDGYTLYKLNVDYPANSKEAKAVFDRVNEEFKSYDIGLSGTIYEENQPVVELWILVLAVVAAMVILIIMCDSYVEPFLFLFTIGLAVFINRGTNIIFKDVSFITDSICAVLQMALSMDYSIMLMNRYTQEKSKGIENKEAMKIALHNAFGSISSSSVTTIVGLLALVFMSFTIGKDLGFVLAKGVLLSLVSIFAVLPGLILMFDPLIEKTKKKHLEVNMSLIGRWNYALRHPLLIAFVVLFGLAFALKGNLNILYTSAENDEVIKVFEGNNQMAIIYDNSNEDDVATFCRNLDDKKVTQALCYGNTLNQKLAYQEFKPKMNDLGADVDIDDETLRIIYYNYYHGDRTGSVTIDQLVKFAEKDVYNSPKFSSEVDSDMRNKISRLKHFSNDYEINLVRDANDIANILELDENEVKQLLLLYHAKNTHTNLTIAEFVRFCESDILNNPEFSKYIDSNTRYRFNILKQFVTTEDLYRFMDSDSMSSVFNMDQSKMRDLYLYYASIHGVDTKLTMHEFARYLIEDLSTNPEYSSLFSEEMMNSIRSLYTLSDTNVVDKVMDTKELASTLGIPEEKVIAVLTYKNVSLLAENNTTVEEFLNTFKEYYDQGVFNNIDTSRVEELMNLYNQVRDNTDVTLNSDSISVVFSNLPKEYVDQVFETLGTDSITSSEFLDAALLELKDELDENTYNTLSTVKDMINANVNGTLYNTYELSMLLNVDSEVMEQIKDTVNNIKTSYSISPRDFVSYLVNNMTDNIISDQMNDEEKALLNKANLIITNIPNSYSDSEMSSILSMDADTVRKIYVLYSRNNIRINRYDLLKFLIEHKDDEILGLDNNTKSQLNTLNNVVDGVINNNYYSSDDMANLLGADLESIRLVYSYYESTNYGYEGISLYNLVNFIIDDVIPGRFSDKVSSSNVVKLNNVNTIMNNSLNNVGYTSVSLYNQLLPLTDELNFKMIDIAYIYYGSIYKYNQNDKLTVEELVAYVNNVILKDNRFVDYISSDEKSTIVEGKKTVRDAKKLLVGSRYSRAVLNTTYDSEGKETYDFIREIKSEFKNNKGLYFIGNSPMAYGLNETFANEFNYISILTMIFIFIVVAITFHSWIIPLILTFVIQCAVYVTMCIISLFGGSMFFISLLIVQSILMGATIDYAILYTSYYLEFRQKYNKKGSIIFAYKNSVHTILTSSSVLIIVTFIVGFLATAIAAKICMTISQGTLCSTLLVLFILPALLASLDRFIVKKN